jgi:hypothetical protein
MVTQTSVLMTSSGSCTLAARIMGCDYNEHAYITPKLSTTVRMTFLLVTLGILLFSDGTYTSETFDKKSPFISEIDFASNQTGMWMKGSAIVCPDPAAGVACDTYIRTLDLPLTLPATFKQVKAFAIGISPSCDTEEFLTFTSTITSSGITSVLIVPYDDIDDFVGSISTKPIERIVLTATFRVATFVTAWIWQLAVLLPLP